MSSTLCTFADKPVTLNVIFSGAPGIWQFGNWLVESGIGPTPFPLKVTWGDAKTIEVAAIKNAGLDRIANPNMYRFLINLRLDI